MQYLFLLSLVIGVLLYLCCFTVQVKCHKSQQTIKMYYVKVVDLTPEAKKKRRYKIPGKDANPPSEEVTEVGSLCPYKDAIIKQITFVVERLFRSPCSLHRRFLGMHGCLQTALNARTLPFLKHTLTETECTLQADFSENYMCHFLEEISSVYYSKDQVKVRPAVIHYKGVNDELETQESRCQMKWRSVASYRLDQASQYRGRNNSKISGSH